MYAEEQKSRKACRRAQEFLRDPGEKAGRFFDKRQISRRVADWGAAEHVDLSACLRTSEIKESDELSRVRHGQQRMLVCVCPNLYLCFSTLLGLHT